MAGHSKRDMLQKFHSQREVAQSIKVIQRTEAVNDHLRGSGVVANSIRNRTTLLKRQASIAVDEVSMVEGALKMRTKTANDVYTPLRKMFAISIDQVLDLDEFAMIRAYGYSRIPVYRPNPKRPDDKGAVCGVLNTKELIVVNPEDCREVSTLPLYSPFCVSPRQNLLQLINLFQTGGNAKRGGHLALVCFQPALAEEALERQEPVPEKAGLIGIVTMEDCFEELIQEEIYDEGDRFELESRERVAKWLAPKWRLYWEKKQKLKREQEEAEREQNIFGMVMDALSPNNANEETSLLDNNNNNNTDSFSLFGLPFPGFGSERSASGGGAARNGDNNNREIV